ncbi:nicotinate-nucleotide adenylyltransferase [Clostridium cochlearium]|uniref:nicotinate-nucleotide adenylyltransferase n=1 Tax=Clostridium cochlearium TaxID=1494 RepID=UPI0014598393|nr:nicotinate-nucleotide adenylyltransferase [Clostridium cochlearium]NME94649.1 nicotinate-nucleotide adenylyltransferase [Clostridium cochlearium]
MNRKAIFGGTFDPIHNGHLHIAYKALDRLKLDKIIFVPSGNPPHKHKECITDKNIRYDMVKYAIEQEKKFEISDYEIKKKGKSYTYETIEYFNKYCPNTELYFIAGADCLMDIHNWKNVRSIMEKAKLVVFNRPGYSVKSILFEKSRVEERFKKNIIFLDIPLLDISSTEIREKIKNKQEVVNLLPKKTYSIINKYKLYR